LFTKISRLREQGRQLIEETTYPGVTTEPDKCPTPAPIPISQTERLQLATAEWNILLHRQPTEVPMTDRTDVHLSPENLQNNIPWGDSLQPKETNTFQICCQNANGLRLDHQGGKFATICEIALEVQADLIGLTEHKWCDGPTRLFLAREIKLLL
jgi:hypothetical protein